MDPSATLERLREAYGVNDWDEIRDASADLLNWIRRGGFVPALSEPQLSALLIMAAGYGCGKTTWHADDAWKGSDR